MNYSHSNVMIFYIAISISNFSVELVGSINQGSHEPIKVIMVREFDILIGVSHVEFSSGTLGLI